MGTWIQGLGFRFELAQDCLEFRVRCYPRRLPGGCLRFGAAGAEVQG